MLAPLYIDCFRPFEKWKWCVNIYKLKSSVSKMRSEYCWYFSLSPLYNTAVSVETMTLTNLCFRRDGLRTEQKNQSLKAKYPIQKKTKSFVFSNVDILMFWCGNKINIFGFWWLVGKKTWHVSVSMTSIKTGYGIFSFANLYMNKTKRIGNILSEEVTWLRCPELGKTCVGPNCHHLVQNGNPWITSVI